MGVKKLRPLVSKDIISSYPFQEAQYTLLGQVGALVRDTLPDAHINVGYTHIVSPVNGVMATIPYKIGSLSSTASTDLFTTVTGIANSYAHFSLN